MDVLACDRNGCENVMCDRLSHEYGYICDECFEEIKYQGVRVDVEKFMDTEKVTNKDTGEATANYFDALFPNVSVDLRKTISRIKGGG